MTLSGTKRRSVYNTSDANVQEIPKVVYFYIQLIWLGNICRYFHVSLRISLLHVSVLHAGHNCQMLHLMQLALGYKYGTCYSDVSTFANTVQSVVYCWLLWRAVINERS